MTTTQDTSTAGAVHDRPAGPPRPRWWRRPWVAPLAVVSVVFLAYSLPPYLGLDPSRSRVPAPEGVGAYYPLLVAHVGFASVALTTCCLQVWPWFRQRHPAAHRWIGRVYVFGGVLPAGLTVLPIAVLSPFGPVAQVSNTLLGLVWLGCTITGFRMARARRFADHRRWMIRSFALTTSIITNRLWAVVWAMALVPQLDTTFGGDEQALMRTVSGLTTWCGWVIPLLLAQWWLDRHPRPGPPPARGARSRGARPAPSATTAGT